MLTKKSTWKRVFHLRAELCLAELIQTKFCTWTPWTDGVICLNSIQISLGFERGVGCEFWPLPLTVALDVCLMLAASQK